MANGHVKIHDTFTNHNGLKSDVDDDDVTNDDSAGMKDTVEFRLMTVYAKRRQEEAGSADLNGTLSPQPPLIQSDTDVTDEKMKKKKMKKGLKGWKHLFSCIKPRSHDEEPVCDLPPQSDVEFRSGGFPEDVKPVDELEEAATRLVEIADEIPFIPSELETDNHEDNVERLIGLVLREAGDRLNEQELRDVSLARELFWNYSFFKTLITELLRRMGLRSSDPDSPGPRASPKTQIAVTCEATSRLSALDTLPMNRLLGYGARFLSENYSSWVEEQGGYDAAFESDDEDKVQ